MTTIILTIIGILLASAAALMVIFYGGEAFSSSRSKAQANELINFANNVAAAQAIYKTQNGRYADTFDALTDRYGTHGTKYLQGDLPSRYAFGDDMGLEVLGGRPGMYVIATDPALCAQVNKVLKQGSQTVPTNATFASGKRMGCQENMYGPGTEGSFFSYG